MKFLFINPPYVIGEDGYSVPPNKAMLSTGLISVASLIQSLSPQNDVELADLVFQKDWRKYLAQFGASFDRVLICCHTARNVIPVKMILDFLREQGLRSHITIGGNLALEFGVNEFSKVGIEVDAVVRGYGHGETIAMTIEGRKGDLKERMVSHEVPIPNLLLLDKKTRALYRRHSEHLYPIIGPGGFGCRWFQNCNYCGSHMGLTSTPRDFDNLLREVVMAMRFGYRDFWCVDNLVNAFPEQLLKFDSALYLRGSTWSGMTRPELVVKNSKMVERLKACHEVAMGVESSSADQLASYNRGMGIAYHDQIHEAFEVVNKHRIKSTAFVILDGPQETEQSFWQLYQFLKSLKPSSVSWSFLNPSPSIGLLNEGRSPGEYGFYNNPMGCSDIPRERVIQQVMILSGVWWCGWQLDEDNPFFENEREFGVRFRGKLLSQRRDARSLIGDLWEIWEEQDT